MLFNSIEFLLFFPIVSLLYYLLPFKYRWLLLLIASCFFYMSFIPQYILILLVTILIDYFAAIWIENADQRQKKKYLVISIVSTCLVLVIFKYLNFFNENMIQLSHLFGFHYPEKAINIILPIGLSFHTFQSLSYVIEVYHGRQKAEKHFGIYSLYVMFYPQLVTGPIERPQNLLNQLRQEKKFDFNNLRDGLVLIIFGLFTKMVIADNVGFYVDQVYKSTDSYNSWSIILAMFLYSVQIYCDFFGYSTIAVGCAKSMGYSLMDNFRNPYLSGSISQFWQRWHISLSTWFRDYVYFPLGGNKVKTEKWIFNICVVFGISGLWHGASWTFIIWGLTHGFFYILETFANNGISEKILHTIRQNKFLHTLSVLKTFVIVSLLWIFFRAGNMTQLKLVFSSIRNNFSHTNFQSITHISLFFLFIFVIFEFLLYKTRIDYWLAKKNLALQYLVLSFFIYCIICFSSVVNYPFIYFQF